MQIRHANLILLVLSVQTCKRHTVGPGTCISSCKAVFILQRALTLHIRKSYKVNWKLLKGHQGKDYQSRPKCLGLPLSTSPSFENLFFSFGHSFENVDILFYLSFSSHLCMNCKSTILTHSFKIPSKFGHRFTKLWLKPCYTDPSWNRIFSFSFI